MNCHAAESLRVERHMVLDLYLKTWFSGLRGPSGAPIIGFRWWPGIGTLTWRAYIYASQMTCVTRHTNKQAHIGNNLVRSMRSMHRPPSPWCCEDVRKRWRYETSPSTILSQVFNGLYHLVPQLLIESQPLIWLVLQQSQLSSRNDHTLKAERVHLPSSTVYTQDSLLLRHYLSIGIIQPTWWVMLRIGKSYMIKLLNIKCNYAPQLKIANAMNYEMHTSTNIWNYFEK